MKYVSKPTVIDAIRYDGRNEHALVKWASELEQRRNWDMSWSMTAGGDFLISTGQGNMRVRPGDYVVCEANGELSPCKPDIFEAKYARAEGMQ